MWAKEADWGCRYGDLCGHATGCMRPEYTKMGERGRARDRRATGPSLRDCKADSKCGTLGTDAWPRMAPAALPMASLSATPADVQPGRSGTVMFVADARLDAVEHDQIPHYRPSQSPVDLPNDVSGPARSGRVPALGKLHQPRDQLVARLGPHEPIARRGQILRFSNPLHRL